MKISGIKASITSAPRTLQLSVHEESIDDVREYLVERGRKGLSENPVSVTIDEWRKRKTYDQCKLFWSLTRIICTEQDGKYDRDVELSIYAGLVAMYAPRIKSYKTNEYVPKTLSQMTTVEASGLIEGAFRELAEMGVCLDNADDVKRYYKEWRTWKAKREEWDTRTVEEYRRDIPYCEVCGEKEGLHMAHIVSKGAGVTETEAGYYLHLCTHHHIGIQHQSGWEELLKKAPWLAGKVKLAREKAGKKYLSK